MENENPTYREKEEAHEDSDHHCCHLLGLAISMAGPVAAHDGQPETVTKNFEMTISNVSGKSADRPESQLRAGPGFPVPHSWEIVLHLRLCDLGCDRGFSFPTDQGMAKVSLAPHMPNMMMKATNPAAAALAIRKRSANGRATPWASSTDRPPAARCERTKKTARP